MMVPTGHLRFNNGLLQVWWIDIDRDAPCEFLECLAIEPPDSWHGGEWRDVPVVTE